MKAQNAKNTVSRKTAPASSQNQYGNDSGGENEDLEDLYGIDKATI